MAEGRLHYVRTQESMRLLAIPPFFIKIFRFPTQISILISHTCPYLLHLIWTITGKKIILMKKTDVV